MGKYEIVNAIKGSRPDKIFGNGSYLLNRKVTVTDKDSGRIYHYDVVFTDSKEIIKTLPNGDKINLSELYEESKKKSLS